MEPWSIFAIFLEVSLDWWLCDASDIFGGVSLVDVPWGRSGWGQAGADVGASRSNNSLWINLLYQTNEHK